MLTLEQLAAIQRGELSIEDALKQDRPVNGCCAGQTKIAAGKRKGPDKLEQALAELAEKRSVMSEEDIRKTEKRIIKLYERQVDRIGEDRMRKSVDGRYGYVVECEPGFVPHDPVCRMEKHPNGLLAPITETGKAGHAYAIPEPTVGEGYRAWMEDPSQESDWSGCPLDEPGEFIPAQREFKVTNALTYAVCKAKTVVPACNGPAVVHKKPLDSAAGCHRGCYRAPLARFLPVRRAGITTPLNSRTYGGFIDGVHPDDFDRVVEVAVTREAERA
jgi:hypothetical protein